MILYQQINCLSRPEACQSVSNSSFKKLVSFLELPTVAFVVADFKLLGSELFIQLLSRKLYVSTVYFVFIFLYLFFDNMFGSTFAVP